MALVYNTSVVLGIKDRNGAFIGEFDSNHVLVKDYYYLKNEELKNNKVDIIFDEVIDFKKVLQFVKNKDCINPHFLVPLYVKKIEVEHD